MAHSIVELDTGKHFKLSQAKRFVEEQCTHKWVEGNIRRLSLAEMIARRSAQARNAESLPGKEIPGVIERMPVSEVWTAHVKYEVLAAARQVANEATQTTRTL